MRRSFRDEFSHDDTRENFQVRIDGSLFVLINLVNLLLEKGLLTAKDLERLLPHDNGRTVVSIDDDWDTP